MTTLKPLEFKAEDLEPVIFTRPRREETEIGVRLTTMEHPHVWADGCHLQSLGPGWRVTPIPRDSDSGRKAITSFVEYRAGRERQRIEEEKRAIASAEARAAREQAMASLEVGSYCTAFHYRAKVFMLARVEQIKVISRGRRKGACEIRVAKWTRRTGLWGNRGMLTEFYFGWLLTPEEAEQIMSGAKIYKIDRVSGEMVRPEHAAKGAKA